jgi:aminocarboxymuconate-semialdehyde decarboxylase
MHNPLPSAHGTNLADFADQLDMTPGGRLYNLAKGPIDVHTHLIDPHLPDINREHPGAFPTVDRHGETDATINLGGRIYRRIDERSWSVAARLRDMDDEGIALQVVSPIPVTLCHGEPAEGAAALAKAQNDYAASFVAEAPDRFLALGAVPMQDVSLAIIELRRCVTQLGMIGVEIGTRIGTRELSDAEFAPFFAEASQLTAVLLIHPVDQILDPRLADLGIDFGLGMPSETATAAAGLLTRGTLDGFPQAQIVLAHGGGSLPAILPRLARGPRIADAAIRETDLVTHRASRLWADSLTYDADALQHAITRFGANHVVLGTDYPFAARETSPGAVLAGLDAAQRRRFECGNAYELFAAVAAAHHSPEGPRE